jgi:nuclease-like protein
MDMHNEVQVFLGDPIEDDNERRVLSRLQSDLHRLRVPARICANFIATGKRHRQVDLLVLTAHRCVQVEVKNLDPGLPLIGQANGPWRQVLPGGGERPLDRNYFWQAREATFAVSDVMRAVARRGEAPDDIPFYRHLDSVLCLYPDVPAGSELGRFEHVTVIGYDQLVGRLATDGPRPRWDDSHWDAFARYLGLYRNTRESPGERAGREDQAIAEDYRRRFAADLEPGLHELVPVTARVGEMMNAGPLDGIVAAAEAGRTVTVAGPRGGGKTHTARHAALILARRGLLPVWVRCSEYAGGQFGELLARATAPYAVDRPSELIRRARKAGAAPVIILDGLNECPPGLAGELLEQAAAVRLRGPCAVVITSTGQVPVPVTADPVHVELQLPGPAERRALLSSYGAAGIPASSAFQTPLELALAAECINELGPGATTADLFDAYVRLRASGPARGTLRRLAAEMNATVRSALTVPEASLLLERAGTPPDGPDPDAVLGNPLLTVGQGRVSFRHEQFGRFLAAEHLVVGTPNPEALARALEDPRHADLREFAVGIEQDEDRRLDLLLALADEQLLAAADVGQFGAGITARLRGVVSGMLAEATVATAAAELHLAGNTDVRFRGRWRMPARRTALETALLKVAGRGLRRGAFTAEAAALLDATDTRCAAEMRRLREEGDKLPVSEVVGDTYIPGLVAPRESDYLPATILISASERDWARPDHPGQAAGLVSPVLHATNSAPRWGRLYLALLLADPHNTEDAARLPSLVEAAWKAGGYHLRLKALDTVVHAGRRIDDQARAQLASVLRSFDVSGNIWLSTMLVEALAACEAFEPMNALDQIRGEISAVLAEPNNPDAWAAAASIYYRQFENEDIVGPYSEAIAALDGRQTLQLCVMAARAESRNWQPGWVLREIADRAALADDAAREVLRQAATGIADSPFPVEAVQAHLAGLRGWARIAGRLPDAGQADGDLGQRAWRLVDELIFRLERNERADEDQAARLWEELHGPCARAAVDVLSMVRHASAMESFTHPAAQPYDRLVEAYPGQIRLLLQWALPHRDRLVPTTRLPARELTNYMFAELGRVGDADTMVLLHAYVPDRELGPLAVQAIRVIERRLAGCA